MACAYAPVTQRLHEHTERDLRQPTWAVERRSEGLSLTQRRVHAPTIAERAEGRMQGEAQVDGLLTQVACLRQMRQDIECLLAVAPCLVVSRARQALSPACRQ